MGGSASQTLLGSGYTGLGIMHTADEGYFRQLCTHLGFVCIGVDRDLRITFWNDQATAQFGKSAEQIQGRSFLEILSQPDREDTKQRIEQVFALKESQEMEIKYPCESGEPTSMVLILSPILDESQSCIGISASMRDISLRKRLSRENAYSRRIASLGRMAGGVAHHFNNILGGMLTSIDYVLTSDSPRELRRTLRLLAQAIGRATRITHQLAAFAESENESVECKELNEIMESFVERIRVQARKRKIQLNTDIAKVASVSFESQRLMPVLESLAQNAFDAMTDGDTLTVTMIEKNDEAVITLTDTGCGIPQDIQDRLFEPFFTTKGELAGGGGKNIGLGLAVVHGLVAEMGGTIHLTSQPGEGTTVEVALPLHKSKV